MKSRILFLVLIIAAIVMVINQKFFVSGFKSLLHGAPNMDTLVALGSGASFVWSVYALFAMTGAQVSDGSDAAMHWMHQFYFESAAMILTLITVGKMLEARSKGKTTDALKALMRLAPQTATVIRDGAEKEVRLDWSAFGGAIAANQEVQAIRTSGAIAEGEHWQETAAPRTGPAGS